MKLICFTILFFNFFTVNLVYTQAELDSVNILIRESKNDSLKFEHLYSKIKIFRSLEQIDSAIAISNEMIHLAGDNVDLRARAYFIKSTTYSQIEDYEAAEQILNDFSLGLTELDTLQLAKVNDKLAMVAYGKGDITISISYFYKGLIYYEMLDNPVSSYRALSILYGQIDDIEKSLFYNQKVISIATEKNDYKSLARAYLSQGYQYIQLNKYARSYESSNKAVDIYLNVLKDSTDERLSIVYGNIVEVYLYFHENNIDSIRIINPHFNEVENLDVAVLDTVELLIRKSLSISEIKMLDHQVFSSINGYGDFYYYKKEYKKALKEYVRSFNICEGKVNMIRNEITATSKLVACYKSLGDAKNTLFYLEKNITLQDSLLDDDKKLELGRLEGKHESEAQKMKEDLERLKIEAINNAKLEKEKAIAKAFKKKRLIIIYSISFGLLLLIVFAFFLNKRLAFSRQQRLLIEKQKEVIEIDRNSIVSSIEYSKEIQKRVYQTKSEWKSFLPQSFIFFIPKDIVSGDFYWVYKKGVKTFFCVADCTGHGVSGAFMTLVSLNLINAIINEKDVDTPALLLERLNVRLKEKLSIAKHDKIKHGLDIAMCAFNHHTNELEYAGLHNPIYILDKENELKELKGDRLYLGISDEFNVTNYILKMDRGDTIYLCTDGFADQKGGKKGKKYYYSQLRKTIQLTNKKPLLERSLFLKEKFLNWKGSQEQIDDVCIIGVTPLN
jgi:serine phosphatase RsbU (regulator of sigma subunit)